MIQANEIRAGNIFNLKRGKGWTWTEMTPTIIGKIFSSDTEYALNDFEPIPLTAAILELFGFEKDDDSEWGGWLSPEYDGEQYRIREGATFYFSIGTLHTPISVKYVHQLQNWYFVVTGGTEFTVNIEQVTP